LRNNASPVADGTIHAAGLRCRAGSFEPFAQRRTFIRMTALPSLLRLSTVALLLATSSVRAAEATYALDPVHTRVMFAVSHAGFSNPMGTISGTTGTLVFDPDDWGKARVEAKIPLERLELGDAKWNAAVLANKFLDAKAHPVATFVSTRVEPIDATHATVVGDLTLRGVTREVKLDVVLNQVKRHPLPPFRRTAGFSAKGTLSRKDFAMTAWQSVVGEEVEIRIEAEGTRSRGGGADDGVEVPTPATTTNAPAEMEPAPAATTNVPVESEPAPPPASEPATPP
jgi:polyisoprenoid-binding protein YceI